jgi:hypothetical protein
MVCSPDKTRFSRLAASSKLRAVLLFALFTGLAHEAVAANTYRYQDDNGRTIYGSTVPPQYVKNGYEVLNERGVVIQTVPRALTAAELAAQEAERAEQEAAELIARQQKEADDLLMRLYRSPEEIARKRDERVTIIDGQVTALVSSLEKVEADVASIQATVDAQKAGGAEAAPQTVESLRIQTAEKDRLVALRTRLNTERATAISDADRDMTRLAQLLGLPPPVETPAASPQEASASEEPSAPEQSATD